jgi:biotin carboxyl carrier protein
MRYYVSLDPDPASPAAAVDVSRLPSGELDVRVDGTAVPTDVVWLDGAASVRVGGAMIDLILEGTPPDLGAVVNGRRRQAKVESERSRAAAAAARRGPTSGGENVVKAPMPGRVVRVLVSAGMAVEAGTTLCVIEAMKMENEVKSKASCTVLEVKAVEGAAVEAGGKLFTLG